MKAETRLFGTIEIEDERIIKFSEGIIGFPDMVNFALIKDDENPDSAIMWLQSMDSGEFAMPVTEPGFIIDDYNPTVNDEFLAPLGELKDEDIYTLVTITVTSDITKMTANVKAPIIINMKTNSAVQLIVEDDFKVKEPIYEILKKKKEDKGE